MDPPRGRQHGEVQAEPQNKPDVMNDPAYDPSAKDKKGNPEEADTCRICRGDASQEEPLFYPCKCSGSIKFVHQNCLMEWLSHSQKKHCELCKTPFHFTKLYHPHMPSTVPLPIFFRQAAVHTWDSMVMSSRFLLVVFVWAAWLPWCMRIIWRGLFWIGDGAWANWTERRLQNETMALDISARLAMEGTSPVKQGLLTSKEATASVFVAQISNKLPRLIPPISQMFNFSTGQPWGLALLRKVYYYITGGGPGPTLTPTSAPSNVTSHVGPGARSSWLSEVGFLRTLTRSTMLNNLFIDTLEGQLITLFVVVAFILIFLIREWVVQQQPVLNGGIDIDAEVPVAQHADPPAPQQPDDQIREAPEGGDPVADVDEGMQAPGPRARMIARARARRPRAVRRASEQDGTQMDDVASTAATDGSEAERMNAESVGSIPPSGPNDDSSTPFTSGPDPNQRQRPGMPDRDTLARAAEIRLTIEEYSRASDAPGAAINVLKDFWDRAGREPLEVIRIIEQEGRSDELGWIVAAMNKIEGLRQEARPARADMSSTFVNKSPQNDSGSQGDDDEGFTLVNRPASSPRPASEAASNANPEAPSSSNSGPQPPSSIASPRSETTEPASPSNSRSPSFVAQAFPDEDGHQKASIAVPGEQTAASSSLNQHSINSEARATPISQAHDNPFHPDYEGELPDASSYPVDLLNDSQTQTPPVQEAPTHDRTIAERVSDWLWGGVAPLPVIPEQPVGDDEHVVNDIADEAPFVPIDHGQPLRLAANDRAVANQDPEVVAAAMQAGIDPNEADAVDEIEDLEGILELVGMQGPLAGLVQNGMFCACLVSLTILFGVWIPYVSGKVFLVLLAHPFSLLFRIPLRWAASTADTVIDVSTICAGWAIYLTDTIIRFICAPIGWMVPPLGRITQNKILSEAARSYAEATMRRLAASFAATGDVLAETDIPMFSVTAHESLRSIETRMAWGFQVISDQVAALFQIAYNSSSVTEFLKHSASSLWDHITSVARSMAEKASAAMTWPSLLQISPLRINLNLPQRTLPFDYDLAYWSIKDRAIAIVFGYLFFALLGVLYLRLSSWMNGTNKAGRVTGGVADGLYQAGGVMKVVLIISIEMIAFPLYCGLLLDLALLPLFGNVTIMTRIHFTFTSPTTSLFVHWFVGTCYMFHFALFVSMCRKILRPGVLYFIRDPDDPTFHPVRDVLERSVSTQLWKISFSALVYGALVIVCLGGVVWGIAYTFADVLPIQWASNEPVLEFPVDLLFYNFLMPLAVKFFKPSKGLNQIYTWWFRKCARALRLTDFLFGEKKEDEEGRHVRRALTDVPDGAEGHVHEPDDPGSSFIREGRYVRAPGSDQVRIPKDAHSFLEVDEDNNRVDGQPDPDDGLHGRKNELFKAVYVPPNFRIRISAFILLIWLFAAATGISMTIVPLVFGRLIFAKLAPNHLRMNDIYAFSIGVYILGAAFYGILHRHTIATYVRDTLTPHTTTIASFLRKFGSLTVRFLSLVYTYAAFGIFFPALLSLLMEFYLIIPLHTYFCTTFTSLDAIQSERHIIHLIQDWTLGVLYLKMAARVILWNTPSRAATALRAIVRDGWLNPDAQLATRGFIIPAVLAMSVALAAPLGLGWLANTTILRAHSAQDEVFKACVYRYSYPGVLAVGFAVALAWVLSKAFTGWRMKVRDEVYLIGERLHNFGETKRRKGVGKGKGRAEVGVN